MMGEFGLMIVLWALLIAGSIMLVRQWTGQKTGAPHNARERPTAIHAIEEQFARGDFDRDEILAKRNDLE